MRLSLLDDNMIRTLDYYNTLIFSKKSDFPIVFPVKYSNNT